MTTMINAASLDERTPSERQSNYLRKPANSSAMKSGEDAIRLAGKSRAEHFFTQLESDMNSENVTHIGQATRARTRRQHDYSRVAGKLFAIFELLCTVVRETQEYAEDHKEPIMREIGGTDIVGDNGLLKEALSGVAAAAGRALDAADPEEAERIKLLSNRS